MSRVYLVGAGVIAREHAKAAALLPKGEHELVVHDANPAAVASFVKDFPKARAVDSIDALFSEAPRDDDIAVIAVPPFAHAELACRALESGRHTLCEKPLAMSKAEVERMFATAAHCRRLVGCCSNRFRGYQTTEMAKRLCSEGRIGKPYHLTCVQKKRRGRPGIEAQPQSSGFWIVRAAAGERRWTGACTTSPRCSIFSSRSG